MSLVTHYLSTPSPPPASLTLLTSTFGTSTAWLAARLIGARLEEDKDAGAVVLVSWMRGEEFWRGEGRRCAIPDLAKPHSASPSRFAFVDGMAALAQSAHPDTTVLPNLESTVRAATASLAAGKVTLVLDAPDVLLATVPTVTPAALNTALQRWRGGVDNTIVTLSADLPLIGVSDPQLAQGAHAQPPTPLELASASFLAQQAHAARMVMSVRELETGAAKDVSGVLRITRGGDAADDGEASRGVREMEALFLVARDGGVKVFERGSAD